jgi:hypothetical protein
MGDGEASDRGTGRSARPGVSLRLTGRTDDMPLNEMTRRTAATRLIRAGAREALSRVSDRHRFPLSPAGTAARRMVFHVRTLARRPAAWKESADDKSGHRSICQLRQHI